MLHLYPRRPVCRIGVPMKLTRTLIAALALVAFGSAVYAEDAPAKKEACKEGKCCKEKCDKDKKDAGVKADDKKTK